MRPIASLVFPHACRNPQRLGHVTPSSVLTVSLDGTIIPASKSVASASNLKVPDSMLSYAERGAQIP